MKRIFSILVALVLIFLFSSCTKENEQGISNTETNSDEIVLTSEYYLPTDYKLFLPDGTVLTTFTAKYNNDGLLVSCERVLKIISENETITDRMTCSHEMTENIILQYGKCERLYENDTNKNSAWDGNMYFVYNMEGCYSGGGFCDSSDSIEKLTENNKELFTASAVEIPSSYGAKLFLNYEYASKSLFVNNSEKGHKNVLTYDNENDTVDIYCKCSSCDELKKITEEELICDARQCNQVKVSDGYKFCYPIFNSIEEIDADGTVTTKTFYEDGTLGEEIKWIPVSRKSFEVFKYFDWDCDRWPTISIFAQR